MNLRLITLTGVVALGVLLPFAGAFADPSASGGPSRSADSGTASPHGASDARTAEEGPAGQQAEGPDGAEGPSGSTDSSASTDASRPEGSGQDTSGNQDAASAGAHDAESGKAPLLSGLGLSTAAQCGPELSSTDGLEAQTCVLTQGRDTWGRTYYRNATGEELRAVLTLLQPNGRTVQMHCAVGAGDEPGVCETPREPTEGKAAAYTAVAEFAAAEGAEAGGGQPLLLRSGSNSAAPAAD